MLPARTQRLHDALNTLDAEELSTFPEFQAQFNAYLAEYGHRETVTPVLVTPPTQGEAPETVLALIKVLAAEPPRPPSDPDHAMSELLKHPLLRGPRRRARMERWVQAARAGMAFREDSHFYFLKPLPILRKSLLEMGRRLSDVGVLGAPEEVFHLRLNELEAVDDPANLTESEKDELRDAVRTRSARREELTGVRLIDPAAVFPRRETGDALITGTPASSGSATGPVTVIREPAEFGRLTSGDVLVCRLHKPSLDNVVPARGGSGRRLRRTGIARRDRCPRVRHPSRHGHRHWHDHPHRRPAGHRRRHDRPSDRRRAQA